MPSTAPPLAAAAAPQQQQQQQQHQAVGMGLDPATALPTTDTIQAVRDSFVFCLFLFFSLVKILTKFLTLFVFFCSSSFSSFLLPTTTKNPVPRGQRPPHRRRVPGLQLGQARRRCSLPGEAPRKPHLPRRRRRRVDAVGAVVAGVCRAAAAAVLSGGSSSSSAVLKVKTEKKGGNCFVFYLYCKTKKERKKKDLKSFFRFFFCSFQGERGRSRRKKKNPFLSFPFSLSFPLAPFFSAIRKGHVFLRSQEEQQEQRLHFYFRLTKKTRLHSIDDEKMSDPMPLPIDAAGDAAALAGALPVVDLRSVLDGVVDEGQASLESLAAELTGKPGAER